MRNGEADIFIEIECSHAREVEAGLLMQLRKASIDTLWRSTGRHSKDGVRFCFHGISDELSGEEIGAFGGWADDDFHGVQYTGNGAAGRVLESRCTGEGKITRKKEWLWLV